VTTDRMWSWGKYAPDAWFSDRTNGSVMIRGYLALQATAPESSEGLAVWSGHFERSELQVSWMRGSIEVPPPVSFHYVGGQNVVVHQPSEPVQLPAGVYVVMMVPVRSPYRNVDGETERTALARLDMAAGIVAAFVSPNAIYQKVFEFLAEAGGPGAQVMSSPVRRPGASVSLDNDSFRAMSEALNGIAKGGGALPARAAASLRWYAEAQAERSRPEAFVKFWIALEALAFGGNGSPRPLIELLAKSYGQDARWVRDTFSINQLAQLRNDIVHSGQRPMLHGNLLTFVEAVYIDALRARLGLPNERRAETALPEGRPLQVPRWRNSGAVATGYLPERPPG
jgi:Apea-like HEPN